MIDVNSQQHVKQLNDFANFLSFKQTWIFGKFVRDPSRIRALFTGNQFGKTGSVGYEYVLRVLGLHPVAKKNVVYWECSDRQKMKSQDTSEEEKAAWIEVHKTMDTPTWNVTQVAELEKTETDDDTLYICPYCGKEVIKHLRKSNAIRMASETLPGQSANVGATGESAETKNTQYPEFKKWLPPFLIKKDISIRNPSMILTNPHADKDIIVDFVSYQQSVQSTAGTQRMSVWYDEEPPPDFREEQRPRLLAEDGDECFSLTPANHISWMFDEVFEKGHIYYRTKAICDFLRQKDYDPKQIEEVPSEQDIAVFQAATDDNPVLDPEVVQEIHGAIDDPDTLAIRRYGIFKQVSGRVFKDFDYKVHVIDGDDMFPDGIPFNWVHARGIDFHPRTPWGFAMMSLSPDNEAFVWMDWEPSPEKLTHREIAHEVALMGKDYKFRMNLIDPLAEASLIDTRTSLDRINDYFYEMKRDNLCQNAYWRKWDTRGEHGRDEIKKRLANAAKVGKPFNNQVVEQGRTVRLPTLWIFRTAKVVAKSLKQWRWEEYADAKSRHLKGAKNTVEQKWSHHCMVLEAIFKESTFRPGHSRMSSSRSAPNYFRGAGNGRR
jgi:phage terminase large subunit-like protein